VTQQTKGTSGVVVPLLKLAAFTLLVPGAVTLWLPLYLYRAHFRFDSVPWDGLALLAIVLIVLGAAGYFWCGWDFAFAGQGTPAPIAPPKVLVARGLYRFVRNPMYISVLLVLVGESFLFGSLALLRYAVIWFLIFYLFVVLYEEPALKRKFGASYEEYRQRVWRWIPRIPRAG
jgi:protein-S-isoprenylcysteine O-methyltransferase Ste14